MVMDVREVVTQGKLCGEEGVYEEPVKVLTPRAF